MAKPDNHEDTANCEHIGRMLARISDKWTLLVVRVLGGVPVDSMLCVAKSGEISQKVLASTLRDLGERVSRQDRHTLTPPQVEYELTELGSEFLSPVETLADWVVASASRMDEARVAYAKRRAHERADAAASIARRAMIK